MEMPIKIAATTYTEGCESNHVQQALAAQRENPQHGRPICLCVSKGVPIYSARLSVKEKFILKRMPGTGHAHALSCDHYEPPAGVNGLSAVLGQAVDENPETGQTILKLGFSLAKFSGRLPPKPSDSPAATVKDSGGKLSLRAFLHTLWHSAKLDRWPHFTNKKRIYSTVVYHLNKAAESMIVRGNGLVQRLAIPEPDYASAAPGEAARRFSLRVQQIAAPTETGKQMGVVIGEVFGFDNTLNRKNIKLKCAIKEPFYLSDELAKALDRRFETEFALSLNNPEEHLVTVFTYYLDASQYAHINEITFMHCTKEWIPYETRVQGEFIRELIHTNRAFERSLRANLDEKALLATVTLLDTDVAHALYLTEHALTPEQQKQLEEIGKSNIKVWQRPALSSEPPIPQPTLKATLKTQTN